MVGVARSTAGSSALAFLFDSGRRQAAQTLSASLHGLGAAVTALRGVRSLDDAALRLVDDQISEVAVSQLEFDHGHLVKEGWSQYQPLQDAGQRSLEAPGMERDVDVLTPRVTAVRHPKAEILVDGALVHSHVFDLTAEFALSAVTVVVRDGCLVGLRNGDCTLAVSLTLEGHTLASRSQDIDLSALLQLKLTTPFPLSQEAARRLQQRPE